MVILYKFGTSGGQVPEQEELIGVKDGINREYITPTAFSSVLVYYNGQFLVKGVDYEVFNDDTIRLTYIAPHESDILFSIYYKE